jgi:hypothetical protein
MNSLVRFARIRAENEPVLGRDLASLLQAGMKFRVGTEGWYAFWLVWLVRLIGYPKAMTRTVPS